MPTGHDDSPYAKTPANSPKPRSRRPAKKAAAPSAHAHRGSAPAKASTAAKPARSRSERSRRGRMGSGGSQDHGLVSHSTTRGAQLETRAWLLKQYGPHCAYCGLKFTPRVMTLDHVAPRRGQNAYDRRDNLVLACSACNALKRDQSPLAFLLARRSRAAHLLKYGAHLSAGLIELVRPLV